MATPAVAEDLEKKGSLGLQDTQAESKTSTQGDGKAHISDDADESKDTQQSPESLEKEKELPEPMRPGNDKTMMPGLPPININELTTMLRGPNMPAQRIMKEVADKMILKSEESESDDGSVGSSGGGMGMKGLFDCIVEVTLLQNDSDNSEDEDTDESVLREIPCTFCSKIFGSTMTWKTHVLVAHPQQDPSVLNIKRLVSNEADKREKGHPAHRKRSKGSSKSDCDTKDTKSRHGSKTDSKVTVEIPQGEENVPLGKRRSSLSRSHQKGVTAAKQEHKSQQVVQTTKESLPTEKGDPSTSVESTGKEEATHVEEVRGAAPTTLGTSKQPTPSSQKRKCNTEKDQSQEEVVDLNISADPPTTEIKPSEDCPPEKKRKAASSPEEESLVSSSQDPQNVSQTSDPDVSVKKSASGSKRKHTDSPSSEEPKKTRARRSKANAAEKTSSAPTRRSSRRL